MRKNISERIRVVYYKRADAAWKELHMNVSVYVNGSVHRSSVAPASLRPWRQAMADAIA